MSPRTVGVVGLGAMGGAIAANLVARGFAVVGCDPDRARLEAARERGVEAAAGAAELAARVDVAILSLPSAAAFEAVAVAADGLAAGARPGLIAIEASTLPIALKERGRQALAEHGVVLLDCPLSGTGDQAVTGDLAVFASGEEEAVRDCAPVFDGFARSHHYIGAFGAGSKMKFVANHLVALHNVAAAEALLLAEAAGLDPRQTLEVIADSAGTSRMFEQRVPKMIARDYSSGVRATVFRKDLDAIAAFAGSLGVPLPMLSAAVPLFLALVASGRGEEDTAAVFEVLRDLAGDAVDDRGRGA